MAPRGGTYATYATAQDVIHVHVVFLKRDAARAVVEATAPPEGVVWGFPTCLGSRILGQRFA